jgi:WD40 repeat protein
MSIPVSCPKCRRDYTLADTAANKKIRCKECSAIIQVPDVEEDDDYDDNPRGRGRKREGVRNRRGDAYDTPRDSDNRPRRRSRREDDEEDWPEPKKTNGVPLAVWIGAGVGGGVLLLVVGTISLWVMMRPKPPMPPVAGANPNPIVVRPGQPIIINPGKNPPGKPAGPPTPAVWKVKADPLPKTFAFAPDHKIQIPFEQTVSEVLYAVNSPLMAVLQESRAGKSWHIVDMQSGKKQGEVTPPPEVHKMLGLSSDGAYMVYQTSSGSEDVVAVLDTAKNQLAHIVRVPQKGLNRFQSVRLSTGSPTRLVTIRTIDQVPGVEVWDIGGTTPRCSFPLNTRSSYSLEDQDLSPGGRYFAYVSGAPVRTGPIVLHDLEQKGIPVGQLALPADCSQVSGLSFSPDGKHLAALVQLSALKAKIMVWDLATGRLLSDSVLAEKDYIEWSTSGLSKGFHWSSDSQFVVMGSRWFLEPQSAKLVWKLPYQTEHSLIGSYHLGRKERPTGKGGGAFILEPLDHQQLTATLAAVRSGKDPSAATMPILTKANSASARKLATAVSGWKATVRPLGTNKAVKDAIDLQSTAEGIFAVRLSNPESARAAVFGLRSSTGITSGTRLQVQMVDLATGSATPPQVLYQAEIEQLAAHSARKVPTDLSPNGDAYLVADVKEKKRLDVWSSEGKHRAGWLPYEDASNATVTWAGFVDANRVLTLGECGKLILWEVPSCKAIYVLEGCKGIPTLSPQREVLAVAVDQNIQLRNSETGEALGQLPAADFTDLTGMCFRSDGEQLLAMGKAKQGYRLQSWELKRGEARQSVVLTTLDLIHPNLNWCSPDTVLVGSILVDLESKLPLIHYNTNSSGAISASKNEHIWSVVTKSPTEPAKLRRHVFPDAMATAIKRQLARREVVPLTPPGSSIAVRVGGAGTPQMHTDVKRTMSEYLTTSSFTVADNAPLILQITFQPEQPTGRTTTYVPRDGKGGGNIQVSINQIVVAGQLSDARGLIFWSDQRKVETGAPSSIFTMSSIQEELSKQLWQSAASAGRGLLPPFGLVRTARGIDQLPQTMPLVP